MAKTVKINGVTFELRDATLEELENGTDWVREHGRYIARVIETEHPEFKIGAEYFAPYRYKSELVDLVNRKTEKFGASEIEKRIEEARSYGYEYSSALSGAIRVINQAKPNVVVDFGNKTVVVKNKKMEISTEFGPYTLDFENSEDRESWRNELEHCILNRCKFEVYEAEPVAPAPGNPGVEDASMELTDEILDEIVSSGTPAPATLIYNAGNAEEAINSLTANYEPEELKEFMQSFMRVLETMKNAGEDISIYKNAVKLLGHDLHVAPFKYWVTDWYFDDRNYALIVKALKAGEKYELEEV